MPSPLSIIRARAKVLRRRPIYRPLLVTENMYCAEETYPSIYAAVQMAASAYRAEMESKAYVAERVAQFERDAQAMAERHGFNTHALSYQQQRYAFGSLADTRDAADMRRLLNRAYDISAARKVAALQAAE